MTLAVLVIEATPDNLHGVISRWLTKISPSTYIGHISHRIREELWREITPILKGGHATLIYPDQNEQGFTVKTAGEGRYLPIDYDGITLITRAAGGNEQDTNA